MDFSRVFTFNLDEYYPVVPDHPQSYHRYMREALLDHVNLPAEQVHIPDGTVQRAHVAAHCAAYEAAIDELGGIDLQILGLGRSGHIGFNEPGSTAASRTRLIELDAITRRDAAADFGSEDAVPHEAITMGIARRFSTPPRSCWWPAGRTRQPPYGACWRRRSHRSCRRLTSGGTAT